MEKEKPNFIIYSLREICLVVVGILIAVSINNWNEKRKQDIELDNILLNVKEDLNSDIQKIEETLELFITEDTIFEKVLNSKYSIEDYEKDSSIAKLILGFPEVSFNKRGISLLEKFKGNIQQEKEVLVQEIIGFYTEQLWEIQVDYDLLSEDFKENFSYWKNNTDWWAEYIQLKPNEDFIKYAIESKDYKNRVATVRFLINQVYMPELVEFKEIGLELVKKIEKLECQTNNCK